MNAGSNAGINVLYSGTVAAAIEGAFYRHTAIAVSLEYDKKIYDFPKGAHYARKVIEQILAHNPPPGSLFNVNLPVLERGPIRGVKVLAAERVAVHGALRPTGEPARPDVFLGGAGLRVPRTRSRAPTSSLAESYITVTPLQFDLTDHARLQQLKKWEWKVE